jgi:hypothetical protein
MEHPEFDGSSYHRKVDVDLIIKHELKIKK